jgi:hypothetical protein
MLRSLMLNHVDSFSVEGLPEDDGPIVLPRSLLEAISSNAVLNTSSSGYSSNNSSEPGTPVMKRAPVGLQKDASIVEEVGDDDEEGVISFGPPAPPSEHYKGPFSTLEDFEVICEFYGSVPKAEHLLDCLVNAAGLRSLFMKACTTADDALFAQILQVRIITIDYGCEDGRFPGFPSSVTISNPDSPSSCETRVNPGIRS